MLPNTETRKVGPHIWQIRAVRDCVGMALLLILAWTVVRLWDVFLPVFIALLFAYLANPLQHWTAQRWGWSRSLTALFVLSVAGLLIVLFVSSFAPIVTEQINTLQQKLPQYLSTLASKNGIEISEIYKKLTHWAPKFEDPQAFIEQLLNQASRTLSVLSTIVSQAASWALMLVLIPIYFFFFSRSFDNGLHFIGQYLPQQNRTEIIRVLGRMDAATASFFRGRLLVSFIMMGMFAFGWWLTEVPYWFLLSIIGGLFSIIPYASGVVWPLAVLLKYVDLATSGGQISAMDILVWPSLVFLVVQFVEGWLITPWIQSGQLDMSVPTVLIVVFIGGAFGGVLGLLLAIPVAACIKILFEDVILPRVRIWALRH